MSDRLEKKLRSSGFTMIESLLKTRSCRLEKRTEVIVTKRR